MIEWLWPWAFVMLPLPWLIRWIVPVKNNRVQSLRVPFFNVIKQLYEQQYTKAPSQWFKALFMSLIWISLVIAIARPLTIGEALPLPQEGRDLLLAVDISGSMDEQDMELTSGYTDRLSAVKAVVSDFIEKRAGDRIGLILFGEKSYLQTPLTFDTKTVRIQLDEAQTKLAGNATAIGDAIGIAIKRLRDQPAESRVVILLTDGANTAGTDPRKAADIAAEANIRIHTIGIGADSKMVKGMFGRHRVAIRSKPDEATLSYIASKTGGHFFRARDPKQLLKIYDYIDTLEPKPEEQTFRPIKSWVHVPLAVAIILSALIAIVGLIKGLFNRPNLGTPS